ncbi:MAG: PBS lyase [Desulfotalea sp.]
MVKKKIGNPPWCPFCGSKVGRASDAVERKMTEFPVGNCQCGAIYSCDATGLRVGAAMVETLVYACNDNWDFAWELMPEDDYLTGRIENYDETTHHVVAEKNIDGRAVRGVLFFVRLHTEIEELATRLKDRKEAIAQNQIPDFIKSGPRPEVEPELDAKRVKKRANKNLVKKLVEAEDIDELVNLCFDDKKTIRLMQRLLYTPDEAAIWHVAYTIGLVCARVSSREPGQVSELLHRLYEAIHDSAATHWGMIETMGYVISKRADIFGAFTRYLLDFLGQPSCGAHVLWALGEIAKLRPDLIRATPFYNLFHFVNHPDPLMRGLFARLMGNIQASEVTIQIMGLSGDNTEIEICEDGKIIKTTVSEEAKKALDLIRKGEK